MYAVCMVFVRNHICTPITTGVQIFHVSNVLQIEAIYVRHSLQFRKIEMAYNILSAIYNLQPIGSVLHYEELRNLADLREARRRTGGVGGGALHRGRWGRGGKVGWSSYNCNTINAIVDVFMHEYSIMIRNRSVIQGD